MGWIIRRLRPWRRPFRPRASHASGMFMAHIRTFTQVGLLVLILGVGACSWFGSKPAPPVDAAGQDKGQPKEEGPLAAGVLNVLAQKAPPGGSVQLLARLAEEFGWEQQVAQNPLLREKVLAGRIDQQVEPMLLGLYYKNGFTVLPVVGEGHEIARDTIVRGAVGSSRLLVTSRKTVRIIFLKPVQNVQLVYYQDGTEPQVFSVSDQAVVAVRQSLFKHYLR